MGKSGSRKKKSATAGTAATANDNSHTNTAPPSTSPAARHHSSPAAAPLVDGGGLDPSLFLRRAHELKEEGNRRFQTKDYAGAIEQYELALKLTPRSHPDRAVFHSNRAACLMQMRPVDYQAVASECSLALQAQPGFPRALLRRARALEALGKLDLALIDVQSLLKSDPTNRDALDVARRLRAVLGHQEHGRAATVNGLQQTADVPSRPSPAALGASAIGAPISGLGPCLPSRPVTKKSSPSAASPAPSSATTKPEKTPVSVYHQPQQALPNGSESKSQPKAVVLKPFKSSPPPPHVSTMVSTNSSTNSTATNLELSASVNPSTGQKHDPEGKKQRHEIAKVTHWRPLKLIYGHDIRLAQMPVNCSFRVLREVVSKRFPSSKSVLVKYKDVDGDLVTITSSAELRQAEVCLDQTALKDGDESGYVRVKSDVYQMLRLHVVEVSPDEEPPVPEEEEEAEEDNVVDDEGLVRTDESLSNTSNGESVLEAVIDNGIDNGGLEKEVPKEKVTNEEKECKEVEIDDWLFEFAQLFRSHVGIDADAHLDFHELGMELCSEALEETVISEDAQVLFEMAAAKFQEVAALAFFNWGNVYMCAARKKIPLDESAPKDIMATQLQSAYEWVRDRYALAGKKYEESLCIKPDFYEGLLALGQQHFETAKLQWSFALASKVELSSWDSSETIELFNSAEEKMKAATEMWEKLEEQRGNELKDPAAIKKDELLKRRRKQGLSADGQPSLNVPVELSAEEAAEQAAVMRSQIHLFWGNMLFERSQVEFKLGFPGWNKNLDASVERFKLAGASESDITTVIKNHYSNEGSVSSDEVKVIDLRSIAEMDGKDDLRKKLEGET